MKTSLCVCFACAVTVLLVAILVAVVALVPARKKSVEKHETFVPNAEDPAVYCVMVTGKDGFRNCIARASLYNFDIQTYSNKHMIIINHGRYRVGNRQQENLTEIVVDKGNMSLGDLRNLALSHVPPGILWTTWDDDDWRDPHYIEELIHARKVVGCDVLCLTRRCEHDLNTNFSWVSERRDGFVLFVAPRHTDIKYLQADTMEDVRILGDYKSLGMTVFPYIENDPALYIRVVHQNNTSQWVRPGKMSVRKATGSKDVYNEYPLGTEQQEVVRKIISWYYKLFDCNDIVSKRSTT